MLLCFFVKNFAGQSYSKVEDILAFCVFKFKDCLLLKRADWINKMMGGLRHGKSQEKSRNLRYAESFDTPLHTRANGRPKNFVATCLELCIKESQLCNWVSAQLLGVQPYHLLHVLKAAYKCNDQFLVWLLFSHKCVKYVVQEQKRWSKELVLVSACFLEFDAHRLDSQSHVFCSFLLL